MLSVAGCSAFQTNGSEGIQADGSGAQTVTVALEPDQAALQQRQSAIQSRMRDGNMSRREAQRAFQEARTQLLTDAANSFKRRVSDTSGLAIENSIAEAGAFLVTGTPSALVGLLSATEVSALLPEPVFERARSQVGGQNTTRPATSGPPE